jgi:mRNA interferase RelE/StbE
VTYRIEIERKAQHFLRKCDGALRTRLMAAIDQLAEDPRPSGCKKLQGATPDLWRVRVGDYRIIYQICDGVLMVAVTKIGHRKQIYR